jgi:hypothetical protein
VCVDDCRGYSATGSCVQVFACVDSGCCVWLQVLFPDELLRKQLLAVLLNNFGCFYKLYVLCVVSRGALCRVAWRSVSCHPHVLSHRRRWTVSRSCTPR